MLKQHFFYDYYWTIMCGADNNTATVAIIVNSVKTIKQNLKWILKGELFYECSSDEMSGGFIINKC